MNNQPLLKLLLLDKNLLEFNYFLKNSKSFSKLGDLIDATVGYQLYHNTIHSSKEIEEKVFHSKEKYNYEWIPEIKAKNIKMFSIDYTEELFVKRTAKFFRIPQKVFIEGGKLLLREIISKEGLVVAKSDKEVLFPKSVLSIVLLNTFTEERLLTIMGYLTSYVCFFDIVVNGVKGNRKFFPRLSINTLKNLSFNINLFNTDLSIIVAKLIKIININNDENEYFDTYALLQAKIIFNYNMSEPLASSMMEYLKIPMLMQRKVLKEFKKLKN